MNYKTLTRSLRLNVTGRFTVAACCVLTFLSELPILAAGRQQLSGSLPKQMVHLKLQPLNRFPSESNLDLVISLPFRHKDVLEADLRQIYDPSSTNYHHFLTPTQFTSRFGPNEQDYQQLMAFALSNNLAIIRKHSNRAGLHIRGSVSDIEKTFHLKMNLYQHPTENRLFYAPDVEPSIDLDLPVLQISGLDNYSIPKAPRPMAPNPGKAPKQAGGSGPGGIYNGIDLRAAYIPNVTLTGAGQTVGLVTFDGYFTNDIRNYEAAFGLPNVPIQNVYLNGNLIPGTNNGNLEISLDMEMALTMAPGMSKLVIYSGIVPDIYAEIANPTHGEPLPLQISTSFQLYYNTAPIYQSLQQMAMQGQTFFCAAGDAGAYTGGTGPFTPCDYPLVTCVGGTTLTTTGPGGSWVSESAWSGSGGGPSPNYPPDTNFAIPAWQVGMDMSSNLGSTVARNCPDVSMVAANVMVVCNNGITVGVYGTSIASPLWAGFAALINQQSASLGLGAVGFLNPVLYTIGRGANYSSSFHDVTTGNNAHGANTTLYPAVQGYDLCTGWGTPNGQNLINALTGLGEAVWVDFNYTGGTQNGKYLNPYKTIAQGISAVSTGGTIAIRSAGTSSEKTTIVKPMKIIAAAGSATIGQ
jgi:subtilase family serine protease